MFIYLQSVINLKINVYEKFLCGMALALVAVSCSNSDDPEIDNPELGNGVGEYCFRITYKGKSSDSFVKPTLGLSLQSINTDKVRNIYYTDNKDKERVKLDIDPNLSYLEFDVGEKILLFVSILIKKQNLCMSMVFLLLRTKLPPILIMPNCC